jgi:hypothetical protein
MKSIQRISFLLILDSSDWYLVMATSENKIMLILLNRPTATEWKKKVYNQSGHKKKSITNWNTSNVWQVRGIKDEMEWDAKSYVHWVGWKQPDRTEL